MPKKVWTPEARKAFAEKMKNAREQSSQNRKTKTSQTKSPEEAKELNQAHEEASQVPADYSKSNQDLSEILKQLEELKRNNTLMQMAMANQGPQVTAAGVVGTFEKYSVDPAKYPSPIERLAAEPRLKRFAFDENYELTFELQVSSYQTQDGRNVKEPRFALDLLAIRFNEDTGEATNGRYVLKRGVFFEDPQTALVVARDNGVEVDEANEQNFLNEMRYLRMRDWLLEAFYPGISTESKKMKDMVIGGRIVPYFEISSETSETIPFDQLKSKL